MNSRRVSASTYLTMGSRVGVTVGVSVGSGTGAFVGGGGRSVGVAVDVGRSVARGVAVAAGVSVGRSAVGVTVTVGSGADVEVGGVVGVTVKVGSGVLVGRAPVSPARWPVVQARVIQIEKSTSPQLLMERSG